MDAASYSPTTMLPWCEDQDTEVAGRWIPTFENGSYSPDTMLSWGEYQDTEVAGLWNPFFENGLSVMKVPVQTWVQLAHERTQLAQANAALRVQLANAVMPKWKSEDLETSLRTQAALASGEAVTDLLDDINGKFLSLAVSKDYHHVLKEFFKHMLTHASRGFIFEDRALKEVGELVDMLLSGRYIRGFAFRVVLWAIEYESLEFGSRGLENLTNVKKLELNLDSIISREPLHFIWQSLFKCVQAGVVAYGDHVVWKDLQANMFGSAVRALEEPSTWQDPAAMGPHCINACLVAMEHDAGIAAKWFRAFLDPCIKLEPAFYRRMANHKVGKHTAKRIFDMAPKEDRVILCRRAPKVWNTLCNDPTPFRFTLIDADLPKDKKDCAFFKAYVQMFRV
jgi:hypothetical protein